MPVFYKGVVPPEEFAWNALGTQNPFPVHNITLGFSSEYSYKREMRPIYGKKPIGCQFALNDPPLQTLFRSGKDGEQFLIHAGWPTGTPPLAPYAGYNFTAFLAGRDQLKVFRISQWQRKLLFSHLVDCVIGVALLSISFTPWALLLICKSPWIIDRRLSTPNGHPNIGPLALTCLLGAKSRSTLSLVRMELLQEILKGNASAKGDILILKEKGEGLLTLFSPSLPLTLSQLIPEIRRSYELLHSQTVSELVTLGLFKCSPSLARRGYQMTSFVQILLFYCLLSSPYLRYCVGLWSPIEVWILLIVIAIVSLSAFPLTSVIQPRTVKGELLARRWPKYLSQARRLPSTSCQDVFELFCFGHSTRSQKDFSVWWKRQSGEGRVPELVLQLAEPFILRCKEKLR